MPAPISPPPVTTADDDRLPAYLSNGVVGLRVLDNPLRPGLATLSGLEGEHPETRIASVPTIPYPLAGDIEVDGFRLSSHPSAMRDSVQDYDFATGELRSRFLVAAPGHTVRVEVLTFCSRTQPAVVLQETTVRVDRRASITVEAGVDPAGAPGSWRDRSTTVPTASDDSIDGYMLWATLGELATCGLAYWTECSNGLARHDRDEGRDRPLRSSYSTTLEPGEPLVVRQATAVVPSANHAQPHREAVRLAALARRTGFDGLRSENRQAWADLWQARIVVDGAGDRWQAMIDAAFFYVHTSTHRGSLSTHPFGLAQWHGYHYYFGHVMWDVDTFITPALMLTAPDAAGALLDFRIRCADAARENARLGGFRGTQFPWEASPSRGEEAAPAHGDAAAYEHHVSADVALTLARYAYATGDKVFLQTRAWPVLAGVAEWTVSRGVQTARGWEIPRAMGIAERAEPADNSAFVNMASSVALRSALWAAAEVGVTPPAAWRQMADGLVLPMRDGVILDHDGYEASEEKGSTPAALAGVFPGGYELPGDVEEATLRFYLGMADDYAGSPMLSALLGTWAARLGDRVRSAELFESGYGLFTTTRFHNIHEYRPDRFPEQPVSGPFLANAGGLLLGLLYGLPGISLGPGEPSTWCERPVVLPEGWNAIEVERLWVRGEPWSLRARHGDERAQLVR